MKTFKQYITEFAQEYTSKHTSLKQVAATFKMVKFEPNTVNLDLGGGAFELATEYCKQMGVTNLVVDKYNRSKEHNTQNLKHIKEYGGADTVTVNNVLNVIREPEERMNVIQMAKEYLKDDGTAYFLIYYGDKSGIGRITKDNAGDSSWQNNLKTEEYIPEIQRVFSSVSKKSNLIIAKK